MNSYINYLVEANLGLCLFLIVYFIFLSRETDFRLKRGFMLLAVTVSIFFPLLHFNTTRHVVPSLGDFVPTTWLPEVIIQADGTAVAPMVTPGYSVWWYLIVLYSIGVAACLMLFLIRLIRLLSMILKANAHRKDAYLIIESTENKSTFSFFRFIFIGQANQLSAAEKQLIIDHEHVHAQQLHSIDILIINLLNILFWFNPVIRIYKKIFVQLHEFEADARAVSNRDVNGYCSLLAKVALLSADFPLANHFNNSLTVKRIDMIRTLKKNIKHWKLATLLAVFAIFFVVVACQDQVAKNPTSTWVDQKQSAEETFTIVEKSAEAPGGLKGVASFLQENLLYPQEARQQGLEGTVFVQFVVNTDGSLSDFTTIKGVAPILDDEAIRVAKTFPAWTPGTQNGTAVRQRFVLPISFKLNNDNSELPKVTEVLNDLSVEARFTETESGGKKIALGKVTDADNKPLTGVNLIITGTTHGTTTDGNGNFKLEVPNEGGKIAVSSIGYKTAFVSF